MVYDLIFNWYKKALVANVYGVAASLGYRGVDFYASYNKNKGGVSAYSGFGGGAFFTTAEQLGIA